MRKVFIVGGGGFARECYAALTELIRSGESVEFGGFLSHGGYDMDLKSCSDLYRGAWNEHSWGKDDRAVIGVGGNIPVRKKIFSDLKSAGVKFYTLISVRSFLNPQLKYGECNIFINTRVNIDVKIGDGNLFNGDIVVGHDCQIGNFNFFAPRAIILGGVKIGDENTIGASSVLLPNCRIGNHNKIAPLSAVYKGCKDNCYMLGNPAMNV